jgi:hypothetical protein
MPLYRCYLLDTDEHVLGPAFPIDAQGDDEAIGKAKALCHFKERCDSLEVWDGPRVVWRGKSAIGG